MAIVFNKAAFDNAVRLIKAGEFETFADWSEEKPTPDEVDHFIDAHYMSEYGLWFLGKNTDVADSVKEHYVYPCGDLKMIHRAALLETVAQAEKKGNKDIAEAAKKLIAMVNDSDK